MLNGNSFKKNKYYKNIFLHDKGNYYIMVPEKLECLQHSIIDYKMQKLHFTQNLSVLKVAKFYLKTINILK